jgi:hypothetical protein
MRAAAPAARDGHVSGVERRPRLGPFDPSGTTTVLASDGAALSRAACVRRSEPFRRVTATGGTPQKDAVLEWRQSRPWYFVGASPPIGER